MNSGMRPQPMPRARMLWIVAMKLIAPRIEEMPVRWIRKIQASTPPPVKASSESGGYIVQPACGGSKKTLA